MAIPQGKRGMGLEAALNLMHERYGKQCLAAVRQYGVAGRWVGKQRFVAWPKPEQPVDYQACINGRMCVFDAKHTRNQNRWSLDNRYRHQYEAMLYWSRAGALAWFAVESWRYGKMFLSQVMPGSPWPAFMFLDPPSPFLIHLNRNDENLYDWLPAVQSNWM